MKSTLIFLSIVFLSPILVKAQCTEAKDADMAKYKRLTETQDAQGCSQCAMLAMYFCSARYCVKPEDKTKVGEMIAACKANIRTMGQPYCCSELVDKAPQWGAGDSGAPTGSSSSSAPTNSGSGIIPGNATNTNTSSSGSTNQEEMMNNLMRGLTADPNSPFASNPDLIENFITILQESLGEDDDPDSITIFEEVLKQLLGSGILNADQVSMIKKLMNNPSSGK